MALEDTLLETPTATAEPKGFGGWFLGDDV